LEGDEVSIRRHGNAVILEPLTDDWAWLDALVGKLDADSAHGIDEQSDQQERPALDQLFR
jgi:antitoxin VapB